VRFWFAIILCCFVTGQAFAANTGKRKIERITSWSNGVIEVWLFDATTVQHNCIGAGFPNRFFLDAATVTNPAEFDQKISMLITAKASNTDVDLGYVCQADGWPDITIVRWY